MNSFSRLSGSALMAAKVFRNSARKRIRIRRHTAICKDQKAFALRQAATPARGEPADFRAAQGHQRRHHAAFGEAHYRHAARAQRFQRRQVVDEGQIVADAAFQIVRLVVGVGAGLAAVARLNTCLLEEVDIHRRRIAFEEERQAVAGCLAAGSLYVCLFDNQV